MLWLTLPSDNQYDIPMESGPLVDDLPMTIMLEMKAFPLEYVLSIAMWHYQRVGGKSMNTIWLLVMSFISC